MGDYEGKSEGTKPRQEGRFKAEVIGAPECPILRRWTLLELGKRVEEGSGPSRRYKLLLHHFLPNADDRDVHDHPRAFWTFVLRGGYEDMRPCEYCEDRGHGAPNSCPVCEGSGVRLYERMRRGMLRYRPATHRHRTRVGPKGCWTIVVMGPLVRRWGFWRSGKWYAWRDYEKEYGFGMRCD